ncbi:MAG: IS5 family transposase [Pseudomonadota bacterium]
MAQSIGRSRGGRGSKVHAAVDTLGRPLRLEITGAQTHDSKAFYAFTGWRERPKAIVADKAYHSFAIREAIARDGAEAVIPTKSNARIQITHDKTLYAMPNIVERFFCRMKDMRRLSVRYEKLKDTFLGMVQLFAIRCWLN